LKKEGSKMKAIVYTKYGIIDTCYPLSETGEAIRYLETGRARGKVVVSVEQKNIQ
jgi:NADPH:quinone reductase-like Zn-dependent oxidoreductase